MSSHWLTAIISPSPSRWGRDWPLTPLMAAVGWSVFSGFWEQTVSFNTLERKKKLHLLSQEFLFMRPKVYIFQARVHWLRSCTQTQEPRCHTHAHTCTQSVVSSGSRQLQPQAREDDALETGWVTGWKHETPTGHVYVALTYSVWWLHCLSLSPLTPYCGCCCLSAQGIVGRNGTLACRTTSWCF